MLIALIRLSGKSRIKPEAGRLSFSMCMSILSISTTKIKRFRQHPAEFPWKTRRPAGKIPSQGQTPANALLGWHLSSVKSLPILCASIARTSIYILTVVTHCALPAAKRPGAHSDSRPDFLVRRNRADVRPSGQVAGGASSSTSTRRKPLSGKFTDESRRNDFSS